MIHSVLSSFYAVLDILSPPLYFTHPNATYKTHTAHSNTKHKTQSLSQSVNQPLSQSINQSINQSYLSTNAQPTVPSPRLPLPAATIPVPTTHEYYVRHKTTPFPDPDSFHVLKPPRAITKKMDEGGKRCSSFSFSPSLSLFLANPAYHLFDIISYPDSKIMIEDPRGGRTRDENETR